LERRFEITKDGTFGSPPPQVRAAVMARDRGHDVGAGVRVEYLVADAREKTLLLAEDYDGSNVDRAHLWENLVYPATMRVLEACFPAVKWAAYRTVRKHLGDKRQVRLFEY
jgi:DNA polymerase elongation subunit (family B)